ncbi:hypothetical protein CNMCM6106_001783 [Aspergillus hiratsukae]|uniref:Uncharacterized protein n=1 Tax=Aspergillus hiratsukae TaxID=1194566 RepID=A0A8H6UMA7_9EURO|nr:hypothetical protein CNMCM6106_001783 [Aspergillus hiratsukae]
MSSPGPSPDAVYSFNVDTLLASSSQTENFTLHHPVQESSLPFAADWTATTYPSQDVPLGTASQFDWHLPVSAVSQPAFGAALFPVNSGTDSSLNQLPDTDHVVDSRFRQSQGYIVEHGAQGDSVPPFVNPGRPLQSVDQDQVGQTADNMLPPPNSHLSVQGIGSFVAPLLAARVFFTKTVDTEQGLKNVQWVYLGVACFVVLLIILFYLAPMPEVTDADMGYNLFFGVWSQWCYVGTQVAVANYFINFCEEAGYSPATSSNLLAVGQALYAFNRFLASGLMTISSFKPRYILAVYLGLCFVFGLAATLTRGVTSVAMLMLVLWFKSVCFATIFTLALRGLGNHTKRGGSMLVAAISGGAAIPPMTGAVATKTGNFHTAMAIPTAFYVLAWVPPV